jgi:hypothetical protein
VFVDTSVLCELVAVPGKSQRSEEVRAELRQRASAGEQFVLPVTAVIETGNHIAQARTGDRHAAAGRFVALLQAVLAGDRSFRLHQFSWDAAFLQALCDGDSSGATFMQWAGTGQMGGGDIGILVERDRFVERSSLSRAEVGIWTLEAVLGAYA